MAKPRLGKRERAAKRAFYQARELTILNNQTEIRRVQSLDKLLGFKVSRQLQGLQSGGKRTLSPDNLKAHAHTPGCNAFGRGMGYGPKAPLWERSDRVPSPTGRFDKRDSQTQQEAAEKRSKARTEAFKKQLRLGKLFD